MAFMQIDVKKKYEMIIAVIKNEMYKKNIYSFRIRIFRCCYFYTHEPRSDFVKGTMPRDFRLYVFFMNQFP
jgi:hypothetical protein